MSLNAIGKVALAVFKESVRDRVSYSLVLFSVVLMGASFLMSRLTAGQDLKVTKDLGLATMNAIGLLIAIFIGTGLVSKEVERRSIYSILAKPLSRSSFVVGKYAGLVLTLAVNLALMTIAFYVMMLYMTWTTDDPSQLQGAMDRLKADLAGEVVVTLPASSLKNDGREHELTLRYDRVSARLQYQAPLIASKEPVPAPSASHLPLALGGAGLVLLVGVATPLFVRSRRKATQAVMAREDALRQEIDARDRAMEQLRQAQGAMRDTQAAPASDASVRRSDPARDPGLDPGRDPKRSAAETGPQRAPLPLSSAASSTQRRTEYRPADSAPLTVTRLRIVRGMEGVSVLTIPLQGGKLGYELSNDIVLNADSISSRHAEIIAIAGGYAIRDLGSSNGTFIDEVRVGSEPMPLRLGAQLKLGLVTTVCE